MKTDRHVALYQTIRLKEDKKATELIKCMLIDFKDKYRASNYAINHIIEHFEKLVEEDITSRSDLKFLIEVFEKGRRTFERDMSLLAIPNLLKLEFEKIEGVDISFDVYIKHLAKRNSLIERKEMFITNHKLFEAMYIIGKFDDYKNLPKFDVRNFKQEPNYYELEKEVFDIAYSESYEAKSEHEDEEKIILPGNKLFKFQGGHHASMQSEKIFKAIKDGYFESDTSFEDYLNVFFKTPEEHQSEIYLACTTTAFAVLLETFKKRIALTVNYTNIGKSELFITAFKQRPLTRANISNALSKSNSPYISDALKKTIELEKINSLDIIKKVKNVTKSVKKSNI